MMSAPCGRCGRRANVFAPGDAKCWGCVLVEAAERRAAVIAGKVKFGPWHYRDDNLTIECADGYYIDLERMQTAAHVLDAIAQVSGKPGRFTAEDVGHLVRALDEVLHLQANVVHVPQFDPGKVIDRVTREEGRP